MNVIRAWSGWLSDDPDRDNAVPGPISVQYQRAGAWTQAHPTTVDAMLAAFIGACTVPQLVFWAKQPSGGFGLRLLFTALMVAPLIWRRRFPLSVFAFAAALALVQWSLNVTLAADVALLIYLYTVASRYPVRVGVWAATVVEVGVVMAMFRWNLAKSLGLPSLVAIMLLSAPVMTALLLGMSARSRRQSLASLTDRADQLERERDQQAALAVAAERTRIAREMHDVVAHSLSVMVTLSDAAMVKVVAEPDRAVMAMREVSATGRQANVEMRRLLGVLRTEDARVSRLPQPGLADVDGLIEQVRSTGLRAELTVTGADVPVPPNVGLTIFRIVQEATTNTLKHALSPTEVTVVIGIRPNLIIVRVRDDGARSGALKSAEGLGLTGMRERAAVYDGTVSAGPEPEGGWLVEVRLPLGPVAEAWDPETQSAP